MGAKCWEYILRRKETNSQLDSEAKRDEWKFRNKLDRNYLGFLFLFNKLCKSAEKKYIYYHGSEKKNNESMTYCPGSDRVSLTKSCKCYKLV